MAQITLTHESFAANGSVSSEEVGQKSREVFSSANWNDEYMPDAHKRKGQPEAKLSRRFICKVKFVLFKQQVSHFRVSRLGVTCFSRRRRWRTLMNEKQILDLNSTAVIWGRWRSSLSPGCYWFLSPSKLNGLSSWSLQGRERKEITSEHLDRKDEKADSFHQPAGRSGDEQCTHGVEQRWWAEGPAASFTAYFAMYSCATSRIAQIQWSGIFKLDQVAGQHWCWGYWLENFPLDLTLNLFIWTQASLNSTRMKNKRSQIQFNKYIICCKLWL